jgi:hypothetical protein
MPNTTWNPSDKGSIITLSGGNLIATSTGGATQSVRAIDKQVTGKFYWEVTCNIWTSTVTNTGIVSGNLPTSATFNETNYSCVLLRNGGVTVNASSTGISFGTIANGTVVCIAFDASERKIWFRLGAAGNWNNSATANPATGSGGVFVSLGLAYPAYPGLTLVTVNDQTTANFGDTAFIGAVPSGFTSGWPSGATADTNAIATQTALEQWTAPVPDAQITQVALEQWTVITSVGVQALVTQIALEMWAPLAVIPPPPPRPRRVQNIQRRTRFT